MSVSKLIAEGVAEGVTAFLAQRRAQASEMIEELDGLYDELHQKSGELSAHVFERPEIERAAMKRLMQEINPVNLKEHTQTSAEKHLDLDEMFRGWRKRRNELEGEVHYLTGKLDVQRRKADLAIALLQVVAKES